MSDKILIVDDDREIRDVLRVLLTGEHFEVAEASGGEEALTYLAEPSSTASSGALPGWLVTMRHIFLHRYTPQAMENTSAGISKMPWGRIPAR